MRLKARPEDFQVSEATALRIRKKPGPYQVYRLEKRGWNTADALARIGRAHGVPAERFACGGQMDRDALTRQYVTVAGTEPVTTAADGYRLSFLGYAGEPMGPTRVLARHFTVVLRELADAEVQALGPGAARVAETGVVNYFDDERFGNVDRELGLIGEKLLQHRWEDALRIALTVARPGEHAEARARRRALRERWGDWTACRALAATALEQRAFDRLQADPKAFRDVLATIHPETVNMWIAAYQSFLWNEVVRRLIRGWAPAPAPCGGPTAPEPAGGPAAPALFRAPGVAGDYLFPARPVPQLRDLRIPLPGSGMRLDSPAAGAVLKAVLEERGVRWAALEHGEALPGFSFRASPRAVAVVPRGLTLAGPEPDDLYPGTQKMTLRCSLPRGACATMVVKAMAAGHSPG